MASQDIGAVVLERASNVCDMSVHHDTSEPNNSRVDANTVHIWRASLVLSPDQLSDLEATLSADERERAASHVSDLRRTRFIARRAIQRDILARYTRVHARDLEFIYSPNGKPSLAGAAAGSGLTFSASDSGDIAVYAIALDSAIGVDIEQRREVEDAEVIARSHFVARDVAAIVNAPHAERSDAFLRCWVRVEASIKACGGTVWDTVEAGPADERSVWTHEFQDAGSGFVGALVVNSAGPRAVEWLRWTLGQFARSILRSQQD
jgi:4'-phosphopantetheinyl transferase